MLSLESLSKREYNTIDKRVESRVVEEVRAAGLEVQRAVRHHRLGQDSIHSRGENYANINTGVRKHQCPRGGPRSTLHLSVGFIYSARIQPSL